MGSLKKRFLSPPDFLCCRGGLEGRGEVGARPVQGLQQTDQTRREHDPEGRGSLWTGFHPADQRGEFLLLFFIGFSALDRANFCGLHLPRRLSARPQIIQD